jgi:hypothetical protein
MDKPIFIFSAGWRSGSTLLQRMITSSGEALIWGESGGSLTCFAEAARRYEQMLGSGNIRYAYGFGGNGAESYVQFVESGKDGVHKWIACMNPPEHELLDAFKGMLKHMYADTALKLGYSRWGVKEVIVGIDTAQFLRVLYPAAKFIFLVRNPIACLTSIKRRNWMDRANDKDALDYYANHWLKLAREFRTADFGYHVKHEDMISSPETLDLLSVYLELSIPKDFIKISHADWRATNDNPLSFIEKRRLMRIVKSEMEIYGYEAV